MGEYKIINIFLIKSTNLQQVEWSGTFLAIQIIDKRERYFRPNSLFLDEFFQTILLSLLNFWLSSNKFG